MSVYDHPRTPAPRCPYGGRSHALPTPGRGGFLSARIHTPSGLMTARFGLQGERR